MLKDVVRSANFRSLSVEVDGTSDCSPVPTAVLELASTLLRVEAPAVAITFGSMSNLLISKSRSATDRSISLTRSSRL
jgi:hypothetical protein